jgi:alpha-galactosidase
MTTPPHWATGASTRNKYPDGLTPLIDHVQSLGMRFGIWFEPEMVNLDSDLARAHPDWIQGPGRTAQPAGSKHVLDLTNPEVQRHICSTRSTRSCPRMRSTTSNGITTACSPAAHGRTRRVALYRLLERFEAAFPDVEIESCASGGGRIDFGILGLPRGSGCPIPMTPSSG